MKVDVIIACGGKGSRVGLGFNKLLAPLYGKTVIYHTVSKFITLPEVNNIIISASRHDIPLIKESLHELIGSDRIIYCIGGATRTESIMCGLRHTSSDTNLISIHDGARPFVSTEIIYDSIRSAMEHGSGIAATPTVDTVAICGDGKILSVPDRASLYNVQTPQSFLASEIIRAYNMIDGVETFTDDSSVYARYIDTPHLSLGDVTNKKITYPQDLMTCDNCYIGVGYDTHRLVEGRPLILGGINIPHSKGLLGHSDADVLTHAIMDAIFNACGERDIGVHFPDTDPQYKGVDSTILLRKCMDIIRAKGYAISYISAVIKCQKPKLALIIPDMIAKLTNIMAIPQSTLNISATTTEGIGLVGREEGISVQADCICYKI